MQELKAERERKVLDSKLVGRHDPGVFLGGNTPGTFQSVFHDPISFIVGFNVREQDDEFAIGVHELPEFCDAENESTTRCDVTVA